MSKRETALQALLAVITAAVPAADVKRNADVPLDVGPGGRVILRDGDPGEPEVSLSPPLYAFDHRVPVELYVGPDGNPEGALDGLLTDIDAALLADGTLGGAVDHCEPVAPSIEAIPADAGAPLRAARFDILLIYVTASPLG